MMRYVSIIYHGSGNGHDHLPITSDFNTNMHHLDNIILRVAKMVLGLITIDAID